MINQNIKHYEIDSKEELPYTHKKKTYKRFKTISVLRNKRKKKMPRNYVSANEKEALKSLANREDTLITKVDKVGAVVIIDVDGYINEAN